MAVIDRKNHGKTTGPYNGANVTIITSELKFRIIRFEFGYFAGNADNRFSLPLFSHPTTSPPRLSTSQPSPLDIGEFYAERSRKIKKGISIQKFLNCNRIPLGKPPLPGLSVFAP